jgi:hypothetical protein
MKPLLEKKVYGSLEYAPNRADGIDGCFER